MNNSTKNISEEAHTLGLLIKDVKSIILNMFNKPNKIDKELKEGN